MRHSLHFFYKKPINISILESEILMNIPVNYWVNALLPLGFYWGFSSITYWYYWMRPNQMTETHKIQGEKFKFSDIKRDFFLSSISMLMYGFSTGWMFTQEGQAYTAIYNDIFLHSLIWIPTSFFILLVLQDTAYYWVHRTLHHPKVFKYLHELHHRSKNPSVFSSFSVHPFEMGIGLIYGIPVMMYLPVNSFVLHAFALTSILVSSHSHLNIELMPKTWSRHPLMKFLISSNFHNLHHRRYQYNYGFFFTYWDRLMRTNYDVENGTKLAETQALDSAS